jgi:hypothetical protein
LQYNNSLDDGLVHEGAALAIFDLHNPKVGVEFDLLLEPGGGFSSSTASPNGFTHTSSPSPRRAWLSTVVVPSSLEIFKKIAPDSSTPLRNT